MAEELAEVVGGVKGVDRRAMGALSAGHMFTDLNQGAIAALIPFLVSGRGISLAAAGTLILAATVSSSVVQPLFGIFSDKRPLPGLVPIGILLSGIGMALVGVAPNFPLILASVILSGVGIAAFHPESARFANYVSGSRRARGMSFFSVGGNAGVALGPVVATPLVLVFGLAGTLFLFVPAAVMSFVLFRELPRLKAFRPTAAPGGGTASDESAGGEGVKDGTKDSSNGSMWGAFTRMTAVVTLRSFVYFGLLAFVASYYVQSLGESAVWGNVALSVMLVSGAVGTLVLGNLADRIGRRTVLAISMALLGPLIFVFTLSGPVAGMVTIALVGAWIIGTFGVTVVMGQEYLPDRIGLAAGVTMGLSIGLGGVGASVLGLVADTYGLRTMMLSLAVLPVLGFILTLTLPRARRDSRDL